MLFLGIDAYAKKPKPVLKSKLELFSTHSGKGSLISFDCYNAWEISASFIRGFHCENKTDERVYIEWENARIFNSRIVFDDDRRITMGNPKADEAVSPNSCSIKRAITSEANVQNVMDLFDLKGLKKNIGEKSYTSIKIPVRFADNHIEEYRLSFVVWYEMPTNEISK